MHAPRPASRRSRSLTALVAVGALALGILGTSPTAAVAVSAAVNAPAAVAAPAAAVAPGAAVDTGIVKAADLSKFEAGNIISDALFFDGAAMSSAQIQAFLDQKIGSCQNGRCINILNATVSSREAKYSGSTGALICNAYQGGTMRVSELIYRLQVACGISAKVILVMLQKEQGLTTSRAPSDWNLSAAMGQACPDTAPCDPAFKGIGAQLVGGVTQLKTYSAARFGKQPGVNFIQWSPTTACGGSNINIQNWATASLYTYTPYQPNAAALRAGYGLGDGCSAYGNRNFYQYYTDWFGSTRSLGPEAIAAKYKSLGGAAGKLGAVVGQVVCGLASGGCYQDFYGGKIHWSASSGAYATWGGILTAWSNSGFENGALRFPTSDEHCGLPGGGCYQEFQSGKIYWTAGTDARIIREPVLARWAASGYERGVLAYPVEAMQCSLVQGGCYQDFQNGKIYWSEASGAHSARGEILAAWAALGYERGIMGYPVQEQGCGLPNGGCYQDFQNGKIYWSAASGGFPVKGGILAAWGRLAYERGVLGYPTANEQCGLAANGCLQRYQNGTIYWSGPSDARAVRGEILAEYERIGGPTSKLGYPLGEENCGLPGAGCYQEFQGGKLYWSAASGAHATWGGIQSLWAAQKYERGPLGYPTSNEECGLAQQGCAQTFQGGSVYWTGPTDARIVRGAILTKYLAQGGPGGALGYPSANELCTPAGACSQRFERGVLSN